MILRFYFVFFGALFASILAFSEEGQSVDFPRTEISVQGHKLTVELAITDEHRERGLMFRKSLPTGRGMLFVFEQEAPQSFWMKNTFVALSIGFFNAQKQLIDIQDMEVPSEVQLKLPTYVSKQPAKYALEVPKGWFKQKKIKAKDPKAILICTACK